MNGLAGAETALSYLHSLIQPEKGKNVLRIKVDGSPAIIFGVDKVSGKFFVATKSLFNSKTPKINFSDEDIQKNHGTKPDLAKKLSVALKYLPEIIQSGIVQGDFLYDKSDLRTFKYYGRDFVGFNPNTILYGIINPSPLAIQIKEAQIGISVHTSYEGDTISSMIAHVGGKLNLKKSENVFVLPTKFNDDEAFPDSEKINALLENAKKILQQIPSDESFLTPQIRDLLMKFRNELVRAGKVNVDDIQMYEELKDYVRLEVFDKKKKDAEAFISNEQENLMNTFRFIIAINEAKLLIIKHLNERLQTKAIKTFVVKNGKIEPTDNEGFVLSNDKAGETLKLVDRNVYSKNNFEHNDE